MKFRKGKCYRHASDPTFVMCIVGRCRSITFGNCFSAEVSKKGVIPYFEALGFDEKYTAGWTQISLEECVKQLRANNLQMFAEYKAVNKMDPNKIIGPEDYSKIRKLAAKQGLKLIEKK